MKILLLGAEGQLGWQLQRSLAVLGPVQALSRRSQPALDMAQPQQLGALLDACAPTVIVNAAAHTAVDQAEREPELAHAVNALAVAELARWAAAHGAWLVHYSSDYVFDGSGTQPRREDAPCAPLSAYGRSKRAGEEAIVASGCQHLVFRTSWVYAARGGNFARTMLRLMQERAQLRVVADQIGAPTSAELLADVSAHALRLALQAPALGGLYHLVASGQTSWHGYAEHLLARARALRPDAPWLTQAIEPVPSSAYPTPAQRPLNSRLDTQRLQQAFGLHLPDWREGVERLLHEIL
ncbi:MAG: hypothetical protein RIQ97_2707 [Pseudomonadota bacterium]|jgi:dTDP-4-dehydrorhamnose reductase